MPLLAPPRLRSISAALALVWASGAWADPPGLRLEPDEERVERVLASMTPRQKVAQMLLAYPQLDASSPVEVGGVLFVGRTLRDLEKAKAKIASSRARARIPPFFAVDMEGGSSNRMKSHPALRELPGARELARLPDAEVERWGETVGRAMREVGLNMNLAPVLDVAGSGHMFANRRAFGGKPQLVARKAGAYARGLLAAGVLPIGKHFPGYGDLAGDSDHELVSTDWTAAEVERHIAVFEAVRSFLGGVMMSNVAYTAFGPEPAILSAPLVARAHARGWLTMTDDVMVPVLASALAEDDEAPHAGAKQVIRRSLLAGNDLLLTTAPPDWKQGVDIVGVMLEVLEEDPARVAQVDESCRRILRLKDRMGLLDEL